MKSTLPLIGFISFSTGTVIASTNYSRCFAEIVQNNNNASSPWFNKLLDHDGVPVPLNDTSRGKSVSYRTCVNACGHGQEQFKWSTFSQEFSAWLLPYLALLSQLPFGAQDKLENLSSVLLTLGSPTLAAYSIAITILNGRWITRLFSSHSYPNTRNAIRILSSLQQAPLQISLDPYLLSSLIILPENDEWWAELVVWIDYTHTWSISAATSVAWVLIAYVFTVIDSFTDIPGTYNVSGQGVGSAWLWLLPVVIAWLQISPKCDSVRVQQAVRRANEIAFVATQDGSVKLAADVNAQRAIYLQKKRSPLYSDQHITAPVFNYSRVFSWTTTVEVISEYFREATRRADLFEPVSRGQIWLSGDRNVRVRPENRSGTSEEVEDYCKPDLKLSPKSFGSDIWTRVALTSMLAIALQWGTAGATILVVIRTTTVGLGCRSSAYIIYAGTSTVVWAMLVLSSILAHYVSTLQVDFPHRHWRIPNYRAKLAAWISVLLRKLAKVLATVNAVGIILTCLFQFSAFFDRCYCNSSVFWRGIEKAFIVMDPSDDIPSTRAAWIGGVALASGTAFLFLLFVNTMIDPPLPDE